MLFTVRIKGTNPLGEFAYDDVQAGVAPIGEMVAAYPFTYNEEAAITLEAVKRVLEKLDEGQIVEELWAVYPDGRADVFDGRGVLLRQEAQGLGE